MTGAVDTARIVLDASAAANVVMRTGRAPALLTILERSQLVIAPTLFHSEIANTLWKYVCAGDIDKDTALDRYEEATGLVDAFEADERLVTEALSDAIRYQHPVYDLLYLTVARRYGCGILTVDSRLAQLVGKCGESLVGIPD